MLVKMPPKKESNTSKLTEKLDLATLSDEGLLEIAKKANVTVKASTARPELIQAMRGAGLDKFTSSQGDKRDDERSNSPLPPERTQ